MSLLIHHPDNKLALALRKAKPKSALQAIERANANLRAMAGEALAYLDGLLGELDVAFEACGAHPTDEQVLAMYKLVVRMIGIGTVAGIPALDIAARSLCDVIDGMATRNRFDRNPIKVHIDSMRLLRRSEENGISADALLAGLAAVRDRYAVTIATTPAAKP